MWKQPSPSYQTRAIRPKNELYCWGNDSMGQLGHSENIPGSQYVHPAVFQFDEKFDSLSCGATHSGYVIDGFIYMQGENKDGRLGVSTRGIKATTRPLLVHSLVKYQITKISCGLKHTVALAATGEAFTWGCGDEGQLGLGNKLSQHSPQIVALSHNQKNGSQFEEEILPAADVSAGHHHTGVITHDGYIFMFGNGNSGQLGHGKKAIEEHPVKIQIKGEKGSKISCGPQHTLVLTKKGKIYSFGDNSTGQLGNGNKKSSSIPAKVIGFDRTEVTRIIAGYHSAAITFKGQLYIWGESKIGEFLTPHWVARDFENMIADVQMGKDFTLIQDIRGYLWGFGANSKGQLGMGDITDRNQMVKVKSLKYKKVKNVACGNDFVIATGVPFTDLDLKLINNETSVDDHSGIKTTKMVHKHTRSLTPSSIANLRSPRSPNQKLQSSHSDVNLLRTNMAPHKPMNVLKRAQIDTYFDQNGNFLLVPDQCNQSSYKVLDPRDSSKLLKNFSRSTLTKSSNSLFQRTTTEGKQGGQGNGGYPRYSSTIDSLDHHSQEKMSDISGNTRDTKENTRSKESLHGVKKFIDFSGTSPNRPNILTEGNCNDEAWKGTFNPEDFMLAYHTTDGRVGKDALQNPFIKQKQGAINNNSDAPIYYLSNKGDIDQQYSSTNSNFAKDHPESHQIINSTGQSNYFLKNKLIKDQRPSEGFTNSMGTDKKSTKENSEFRLSATDDGSSTVQNSNKPKKSSYWRGSHHSRYNSGNGHDSNFDSPNQSKTMETISIDTPNDEAYKTPTKSHDYLSSGLISPNYNHNRGGSQLQGNGSQLVSPSHFKGPNNFNKNFATAPTDGSDKKRKNSSSNERSPEYYYQTESGNGIPNLHSMSFSSGPMTAEMKASILSVGDSNTPNMLSSVKQSPKSQLFGTKSPHELNSDSEKELTPQKKSTTATEQDSKSSSAFNKKQQSPQKSLARKLTSEEVKNIKDLLLNSAKNSELNTPKSKQLSSGTLTPLNKESSESKKKVSGTDSQELSSSGAEDKKTKKASSYKKKESTKSSSKTGGMLSEESNYTSTKSLQGDEALPSSSGTKKKTKSKLTEEGSDRPASKTKTKSSKSGSSSNHELDETGTKSSSKIASKKKISSCEDSEENLGVSAKTSETSSKKKLSTAKKSKNNAEEDKASQADSKKKIDHPSSSAKKSKTSKTGESSTKSSGKSSATKQPLTMKTRPAKEGSLESESSIDSSNSPNKKKSGLSSKATKNTATKASETEGDSGSKFKSKKRGLSGQVVEGNNKGDVQEGDKPKITKKSGSGKKITAIATKGDHEESHQQESSPSKYKSRRPEGLMLSEISEKATEEGTTKRMQSQSSNRKWVNTQIKQQQEANARQSKLYQSGGVPPTYSRQESIESQDGGRRSLNGRNLQQLGSNVRGSFARNGSFSRKGSIYSVSKNNSFSVDSTSQSPLKDRPNLSPRQSPRGVLAPLKISTFGAQKQSKKKSEDEEKLLEDLKKLETKSKKLEDQNEKKDKKLKSLEKKFKKAKKKADEAIKDPKMKSAQKDLASKTKTHDKIEEELDGFGGLLNQLRKENKELKHIGCPNGDPYHAILENQALEELIKYCMALRDLDKEGVNKETKRRVEEKVTTLMKMLGIANMKKIHADIGTFSSHRTDASGDSHSSVFIPLSKAAPDLSLFDKSSDMTPLRGAPIVESHELFKGRKGGMKATFVKTIPLGNSTPQTNTNLSKATTPTKSRHSRNVSGMTFSALAAKELSEHSKTPESNRKKKTENSTPNTSTPMKSSNKTPIKTPTRVPEGEIPKDQIDKLALIKKLSTIAEDRNETGPKPNTNKSSKTQSLETTAPNSNVHTSRLKNKAGALVKN